MVKIFFVLSRYKKQRQSIEVSDENIAFADSA